MDKTKVPRKNCPQSFLVFHDNCIIMAKSWLLQHIEEKGGVRRQGEAGIAGRIKLLLPGQLFMVFFHLLLQKKKLFKEFERRLVEKMLTSEMVSEQLSCTLKSIAINKDLF